MQTFCVTQMVSSLTRLDTNNNKAIRVWEWAKDFKAYRFNHSLWRCVTSRAPGCHRSSLPAVSALKVLSSFVGNKAGGHYFALRCENVNIGSSVVDCTSTFYLSWLDYRWQLQDQACACSPSISHCGAASCMVQQWLSVLLDKPKHSAEDENLNMTLHENVLQ